MIDDDHNIMMMMILKIIAVEYVSRAFNVHTRKPKKIVPPVYIIWSVVLQQLIHLEIIEIVDTFYCGIYSKEYRNSKEMLMMMMMDEFSVYFLALLLIVVA